MNKKEKDLIDLIKVNIEKPLNTYQKDENTWLREFKAMQILKSIMILSKDCNTYDDFKESISEYMIKIKKYYLNLGFSRFYSNSIDINRIVLSKDRMNTFVSDTVIGELGNDIIRGLSLKYNISIYDIFMDMINSNFKEIYDVFKNSNSWWTDPEGEYIWVLGEILMQLRDPKALEFINNAIKLSSNLMDIEFPDEENKYKNSIDFNKNRLSYYSNSYVNLDNIDAGYMCELYENSTFKYIKEFLGRILLDLNNRDSEQSVSKINLNKKTLHNIITNPELRNIVCKRDVEKINNIYTSDLDVLDLLETSESYRKHILRNMSNVAWLNTNICRDADWKQRLFNIVIEDIKSRKLNLSSENSVKNIKFINDTFFADDPKMNIFKNIYDLFDDKITVVLDLYTIKGII